MSPRKRPPLYWIVTLLVLDSIYIASQSNDIVVGWFKFMAATVIPGSILALLWKLAARRVGPHLTNERFWEAYDEYRWAFGVAMVLQVIGVILGIFVLNGDGGYSFIFASTFFWIVASALFHARRLPMMLERIALATAPALIFVACWRLSTLR